MRNNCEGESNHANHLMAQNQIASVLCSKLRVTHYTHFLLLCLLLLFSLCTLSTIATLHWVTVSKSLSAVIFPPQLWPLSCFCLQRNGRINLTRDRPSCSQCDTSCLACSRHSTAAVSCTFFPLLVCVLLTVRFLWSYTAFLSSCFALNCKLHSETTVPCTDIARHTLSRHTEPGPGTVCPLSHWPEVAKEQRKRKGRRKWEREDERFSTGNKGAIKKQLNSTDHTFNGPSVSMWTREKGRTRFSLSPALLPLDSLRILGDSCLQLHYSWVPK